MAEYLLCMILFGVGLYAILVKRNIIKIILGIGIMDYAINLFFILLGYRKNGDIPLLSKEAATAVMVDPLTQAIVLTTIVIGLGITIVLSGIAIRLYEKYGTFDISNYNKLKG